MPSTDAQRLAAAARRTLAERARQVARAVSKVEDLPLARFEALGDGDILFVGGSLWLRRA